MFVDRRQKIAVVATRDTHAAGTEGAAETTKRRRKKEKEKGKKHRHTKGKRRQRDEGRAGAEEGGSGSSTSSGRNKEPREGDPDGRTASGNVGPSLFILSSPSLYLALGSENMSMAIFGCSTRLKV
jgi:hypothetical protein